MTEKRYVYKDENFTVASEVGRLVVTHERVPGRSEEIYPQPGGFGTSVDPGLAGTLLHPTPEAALTFACATLLGDLQRLQQQEEERRQRDENLTVLSNFFNNLDP